MMTQLRYLVEDLRRWKVDSIIDMLYIFFETGVWSVILYRFSRGLYLVEVPFVRYIFRLIGFLLLKSAEIFLGINIKASCDIGPGFYIGHTGAIVLHPEIIAGDQLSIGTGVILGERGLGSGGVPVLGDHVYIGTGAKILGNVRVGNNVKIGANAVVLEDVPNDKTVVGVPGRIIN